MVSDAVTDMLFEYFLDLEHARKVGVSRPEEHVVNFRVLIGRYLSRVLKQDAGTIFYCLGHGSPHLWDEFDADPTAMHFYRRCAEHPERRKDLDEEDDD